jgi:transcriptional regulator with XRE-family HTH domain
MPSDDPWHGQLQRLGGFIRSQRRLANLSLRQMAELTNVSNPYLSQIERGLHEPSVRVLRSIARALNVSAETILAQAGLLEADANAADEGTHATEAAIRADGALTDAQKEALLAVYRSYVAGNRDVPVPSLPPPAPDVAPPRAASS